MPKQLRLAMSLSQAEPKNPSLSPAPAFGSGLQLQNVETTIVSQRFGSGVNKPLSRSWSCGMLEEYVRQQPALPDLLATVARAPTKAKANAQRAAIRSAMMYARRRDINSDSQRRVLSRSSNTRSRTPGHVNAKVKADTSSLHNKGSQIFGSGPLGVVPENPREPSPGGSSVRTRASPEAERPPTYLIRTDLRYSPTDDTVIALLELPGLKFEDVQLKLGSRSSGIRHLIVTAMSRCPERNSGDVAMQERMYGTFTRTLIVPPHVTASDIQADMRDGLLRLKIPGTKFEDVVIKQAKEECKGD